MFYRLTPAEALLLPGPEYLALCWRTPAYAGAMAARIQAEQDEAQDKEEVAPTRAAIEASPLAGVIDWG